MNSRPLPALVFALVACGSNNSEHTAARASRDSVPVERDGGSSSTDAGFLLIVEPSPAVAVEPASLPELPDIRVPVPRPEPAPPPEPESEPEPEPESEPEPEPEPVPEPPEPIPGEPEPMPEPVSVDAGSPLPSEFHEHAEYLASSGLAPCDQLTWAVTDCCVALDGSAFTCSGTACACEGTTTGYSSAASLCTIAPAVPLRWGCP